MSKKFKLHEVNGKWSYKVLSLRCLAVTPKSHSDPWGIICGFTCTDGWGSSSFCAQRIHAGKRLIWTVVNCHGFASLLEKPAGKIESSFLLFDLSGKQMEIQCLFGRTLLEYQYTEESDRSMCHMLKRNPAAPLTKKDEFLSEYPWQRQNLFTDSTKLFNTSNIGGNNKMKLWGNFIKLFSFILPLSLHHRCYVISFLLSHFPILSYFLLLLFWYVASVVVVCSSWCCFKSLRFWHLLHHTFVSRFNMQVFFQITKFRTRVTYGSKSISSAFTF